MPCALAQAVNRTNSSQSRCTATLATLLFVGVADCMSLGAACLNERARCTVLRLQGLLCFAGTHSCHMQLLPCASNAM